MQKSSTDPRVPFVIGIIVLGVALLGGIIWAVLSAPSESPGLTSDPNLSFRDENDPALGPENSPITVRIFGDFECPACKAAEPGVTHVRRTYGDAVRIIWNDFPLPPSVHPKARVASNAARCAEEQGRFWEMHDALYDSQNSWANSSNPEEDFMSLARQIGLNEDGFRACYDARRYDQKVADDMAEGRANNVDATPTFFINNSRQVGVLSPAQWDAILKPLLTAAASGPRSSDDQTASPAEPAESPSE